MVSKISFLTFLFSFIYTLFYIVIYLNYQKGDFESYHNVFLEIQNLDFWDSYVYYYRLLSASEPIYFLILFSSSKIISHLFFKVVLCFILFYLFYNKIVITLKVSNFFSFFIIFILLSTNYYILALITELERLCVAIIFILLYFKYRNVFFQYFSLLSHFQIIVIFVHKFVYSAILSLCKLKFNLYFVLNAIIFSTILFLAKDYLIQKVQFYFDFNDGHIPHDLILFFFVPFIFKDLNLFIYLTLFFIISLIVGSSRLNILCFFIILYSLSQKRKTFNRDLFIIVLLTYFSLKGFLFINNIYLHGRGY